MNKHTIKILTLLIITLTTIQTVTAESQVFNFEIEVTNETIKLKNQYMNHTTTYPATTENHYPYVFSYSWDGNCPNDPQYDLNINITKITGDYNEIHKQVYGNISKKIMDFIQDNIRPEKDLVDNCTKKIDQLETENLKKHQEKLTAEKNEATCKTETKTQEAIIQDKTLLNNILATTTIALAAVIAYLLIYMNKKGYIGG